MRGKMNMCRIMNEKPEVKILLGRPRRKWKDNIKTYFREIGLCGMDWLSLRTGTDGGLFLNMVMNFRVS
jgi:hypothetical protein